MGFLERHWWVSVLGSLVAVAVMIVGPVVFLQQVLPAAAYLGESPTPDFLLAGALGVAAFVLCLMLTNAAVRGRRRAQLRTEALRGNLDVMSVSLLVADAEKAPNVSRDPLVLSWRESMMQRIHTAPVFLLAAVFIGFILVLAWVALIIDFSRDVTSLRGEWLLLAGLLLATPVYAALMVVLIRYLPTLFGKPFGLTASTEGIHYRTVFGREGFIRWEEMKLLEVEQYGLQSVAVERREFTLYGQSTRQVVAWKDNPPTSRSEFVPNGISQAEMTVRLQALLHLINAHTSLAPRTFSKALRPKEVQSAATQGQANALHGGTNKSSPSDENAGIGVLALGAGITLAIAAAAMLVPMSSLFIVNIAVALSLTILAVILLAYALWSVVRRVRRLRTSQIPVLPPIARNTPFPDTPDSIYSLSFGWPLRHRLVLAIFGLLMLVDVAPVILIVVSSALHGTFPLIISYGSMAPNLGVVLSLTVGIYGIAGILLLAVAFWPIKWTVRADRSALSFGSGMNSSNAIPWELVERISAQMPRDEVVKYIVVGDAGRTRIMWFAEPFGVRILPPIDGTSPIAPDQLAALAAQRSGKDIEAVWA